MRFSAIFVAGLLTASAAAPASAHHAFAAEFDGNKPVRLVGRITRLEWTNPHAWFYLDVVNAKGEVQSWACEGGGPGLLSRRGWKSGVVKIGDTLVVDGYLALDGTRHIDARRIKLPDGRFIYGGTPGDGGPTLGAPPER